MSKTAVTQFLLSKPGYLKWGNKKLSNKLDVDEDTVKAAKYDLLQGQMQEENETENTNETAEDLDPQSNNTAYEQYLNSCGLEKDDIKSVKFWQTMKGEPRFSVVPKNNWHEDELNIAEEFKNHIREYTLTKKRHYKRVDREAMGIINLFDAHIDKIAFTGTGQTIDYNVSIFMETYVDLLKKVLRCSPETIVIPVGSDFFNANDDQNTTKRGTPQDVLVPSRESFRYGLALYRECIDRALEYDVQVEVVVIEGNHDPDKTHYLGTSLEVIYENNEQVDINNDGLERKYLEFGENLIGFAHGNNQKKKVKELPLVMAEEQKQAWGRTSQRIFLLGDIHHKEEHQFMRTEDIIGCEVRFLRALTPTGKWEHDSGYIGIPKTAEAFVFYKDGKSRDNFSRNI